MNTNTANLPMLERISLLFWYAHVRTHNGLATAICFRAYQFTAWLAGTYAKG